MSYDASLVLNDRRGEYSLGLSILPSSSAEMAKRGMMSRLWVLFITSGLALRSDWEELEEARGRRLQGTYSGQRILGKLVYLRRTMMSQQCSSYEKL